MFLFSWLTGPFCSGCAAYFIGRSAGHAIFDAVADQVDQQQALVGVDGASRRRLVSEADAGGRGRSGQLLHLVLGGDAGGFAPAP